MQPPSHSCLQVPVHSSRARSMLCPEPSRLLPKVHKLLQIIFSVISSDFVDVAQRMLRYASSSIPRQLSNPGNALPAAEHSLGLHDFWITRSFPALSLWTCCSKWPTPFFAPNLLPTGTAEKTLVSGLYGDHLKPTPRYDHHTV